MSGCWTDVKHGGENGQSIGNANKACRTWRTSHERVRAAEVVMIVKGKDRSGMRWLPHQNHLGLDKEARREVVELLES